MVSVITVQTSLNLEFQWYLILLEKTFLFFCILYILRNIKKRNIFYEKLWIKLYLNDGKIQVVCWGHNDIWWGLKNVHDGGIFRSLQWLYDLIHHTVYCVLKDVCHSADFIHTYNFALIFKRSKECRIIIAGTASAQC